MPTISYQKKTPVCYRSHLTVNREPQNKTLNLFFAGLTLYPARISCGCFAVHTLTGTYFCTITSCTKKVPFRHLVRIPDEVFFIRRNQSDNKVKMNCCVLLTSLHLKKNLTFKKLKKKYKNCFNFQPLMKTQVILILNFTRIHCDYLLITEHKIGTEFLNAQDCNNRWSRTSF